MRILAALVLVLAACAACGNAPEGAAPSTRIRLATTTSTDNSGLLDYLLPTFAEKTGITVDVVAVGTGQALALGQRGDADVVMVHARSLEDAFVRDGHGVERRDLMWNDFLVAGPADDPAGVKGLDDPAQALAKIAQAGAPFASRGDGSGTHVREKALWEKAGGPARFPLFFDGQKLPFLEAGQGMGNTLTIADEKNAYVLVDRGTWLAREAGLRLVPLVEGDASLHNPYGVILVNPQRHPHVKAKAGRAFIAWLTSKEGQQRIADFRVGGEALFHPASTQ
jgi:tungstate transport system substrate-binding protein